MSRLCPRCNESFEDRWYCPTCGVRLSDQEKSKGPAERKKATGPTKPPAPSRVLATLSRLFALRGATWQQTTWGRCIIGLLLAQGLFYALYHMVLAVMMISGDPSWMERSLGGLLLKQGLQGLSVIAGGFVAGAGQRRAVRNGTIVGLYNAFLFLLVDALIASKRPELTTVPEMIRYLSSLIVPALFQIAFGTLGGYLGRRVWQPAQPIVSVRGAGPAAAAPLKEARTEGTVALATLGVIGAIPLPEPRSSGDPFTGQIHFIRVIIGIAVVVVGTISAQRIFGFIVQERPGLQLSAESKQQIQFITWEISVLAMILGGSIAGANTFTGPFQGTIVGVVSAALLVFYNVQNPSVSDQAQNLPLSFLGIQVNSMVTQLIGTVFSVIPLSIVGGWFGGQLLPPVLPERVTSRTYTAPV